MLNNWLFLCILIGATWGLAPNIGRFSGLGGITMALLVSLGTTLTAFPVVFTPGFVVGTPRGPALALAAGVTNGIGFVAFYWLVAGCNKGLWQASNVLPMVFVLATVVSAFGAIFMHGEAMTIKKVVGLALACAAIWFLS